MECGLLSLWKISQKLSQMKKVDLINFGKPKTPYLGSLAVNFEWTIYFRTTVPFLLIFLEEGFVTLQGIKEDLK